MRTRLWVLLLLLLAAAAHAAGPRFVTGKPYFTGQSGVPIGWHQQQLLYSTDPGDLSATVNHAAVDALVAAAAGVWNVPVASITIAQGPALAEHVSAQNVYFDTAGLHFPADVASANAAALPLAIIYDTDGSVTDTLLGAGASSPSGCRQNAVTESVDAFDPAGYITHAIIVINGRCTGPTPAAQLQLRYQLQRVFGRVLGLAWSQTNDNVFTGTPAPTPAQAQNWPILHPLDILCGQYTYQCLPNPFTLRNDDIAAMVLVYPITGSTPIPPGKQLSYTGAQGLQGRINFPTGEGMAGINVLVQRMVYSTTLPEAYYIASGVTGAFASRSAASPFIAASATPMASQGSTDPGQLGMFLVPWYPILGTVGFDNRIISTEPVNPLYTGEYTLGPYPAGNVAPSGTLPSQTAFVVGPGVDYVQFTLADAAATCGNGADGTPTAPMQAGQTGWWTGLICGYGHVSYVSATVRPGRTFTIEATALDAQGLPTINKLMPVLGLYATADNPPATTPSLAATTTAFNGLTTGTSTLQASTGSATSIRFGIADQRGDGRPDFAYQTRLFYADSIVPAQVANSGGTATISGTGFRNGNTVTVNGVAATVLSWSANAIVIQVPAGTAGAPVDVTVIDRGTGASSTMTAALTYSLTGAQPASMRLISAPAGTLLTGDAAATPFSVELVSADGRTPIPNTAVTFTGPVLFTSCANPCTLRTDASGLATTQLTPTSLGTVTLQATAGALVQKASFNVIAQTSSMNVISVPESTLRVGLASSGRFEVQDIGPDGYHSLPFRAITFTVVSGAATFDVCSASPCTIVANYFGQASVAVIPQQPGPITVRASDGDVSQTITLNAVSNTDILALTQAPPAQFYLDQSNQTFIVTLFHADGITPDPQQTITFTAPPGISFGECTTAVCSLAANWAGRAEVQVIAAATGTYTVQASYGGLTQSVTFTVISHHWQLKVLSQPADGSPTGVTAALPFKVQVVLDDGVTPAPIAGTSLVLGGSPGAVNMTNCIYSACEIWVGADATATAWIIPQQPGPLTLSAIYAPMVATATFNATGGVRTMKVVSQPPDGASTRYESDLYVQVLDATGSPLSSDLVSFNVRSGPYQFYQGHPTFTQQTDGHGVAFVPGLAYGYGPVVIEATDGVVSQRVTFLAGTAPRVMKLVSTPPSPSLTGVAAAQPFTVQVFAQDGITPLAWEQVTFTLTGGAATLGNCASATCVVSTDANGNASVQVTPLTAGLVGLLAADGYVTQATTFQAVAPPDVLRVVSAPASGSFIGVAAPVPFAVQVLLADGKTPAAGRSVALSLTAASATFNACPGVLFCTLVSDASGMVSSTVTPNTPGVITLQALDGQTTVAASFTAVTRPDTMKLVAAPSGAAGVGYAAPTPFTVQIVQGDGTTPQAGKTVVFTATQGSVGFSPSTAITAADGTASTTLTPLAAGPITIVATQGTLSQSATFTAVTQPDVLRITSSPASGGYAGTPSTALFVVQVLLADTVTIAPGRSVLVSLPGGAATLAACGTAAHCTLVSDSNGLISTAVTPNAPGTITLQALDGQTTVTTSFTVTTRPDIMKLIAAPSGTVGVGYAASTPFTVQVLQGDGTTPGPGKTVVFTATQGSVRFSSTSVVTAADGTASASLTPLAAGPVTVTATSGTLSQSATFTAIDEPVILRITSTPAGAGYPGTPSSAPFTVQAVLADGITPAAGKLITLSVTAGAATLAACGGASSCTLPADSSGTLSTPVTPTASGTITLQAAAGGVTVQTSFNVLARPDTLQLVSAPADGSSTGAPAARPFAVRALQADGTTPRAGTLITFTAAGGTATFPGCSTCTLVTDAAGTAAILVTPLTPGTVTLVATAGTHSVSASFTAIANQHLLTALNPNLYVAENSTAELILSAQATQNAQSAAAQSIHWSGSVALQPASSDTLTDASGNTLATVTAAPLAAGTQAQATACAWTTTCTTFTATAVSAAEFTPTILSGAAQSVPALQPVMFAVTDASGHSIAGAPVTVYQTVTAYASSCPAQGRCPASAVLASLVTAATTDANGRYVFTPLSVEGQPTRTEIAVAAGTSGFTTTTLERRP